MRPTRRARSARPARASIIASAITLTCAATLTLTPPRAHAETTTHQPAPPLRPDLHLDDPTLRDAPRFAAGFDIGIGLLGARCSDCTSLGGLSLDAYAGAQITPRLALLADVWSVIHVLPTDGDSAGVAAHTLATAAVRIWYLPEAWISTGFGAGILSVAGGPGFEIGPGMFVAVGGEVDHRPRFGIDLAVRLGLSVLRDEDGDTLDVYSIAALVGWHWY